MQMLSEARAAEQLGRVAWWGAQMEPWAASSHVAITPASTEGRDVKTQHEAHAERQSHLVGEGQGMGCTPLLPAGEGLHAEPLIPAGHQGKNFEANHHNLPISMNRLQCQAYKAAKKGVARVQNLGQLLPGAQLGTCCTVQKAAAAHPSP